MKRLILLLCAAGLVACEPETHYRERMEAQDRIQQAQQALDRATTGTAAEHHEDDEYEPIHAYRRQQLAEAAETLRPLTRSGEASERLIAHNLLAEAELSHADTLIGEASANWNALLNQHSRLLNTVAALRDADAVRDEHAAIDLSDQLDELRRDAEQLLEDREQVERRIAEIDRTIAEIEAEIEEIRGQRRELDARADELSREAFAAEGEEQFDLYVEAAELKKESSLLASQVEGLEGRLSVQQSERNLEQVQVDQIDAQVEQFREAAEELEERGSTISGLADDADDRFRENAEHFDELLQYVIDGHRERVEQVLADVPAHYEEAIAQLENAERAAGRQARDSAQIRLQAARGSYGRAEMTMARMREGYRNLLLSVAEAVSDVLPEHAATMSEVAAETDELADQAVENARARLTSATEQLTEMLEPAEARGDTDLQRALLQHLVVLNSALHTLTDDPTYENQASQHQNQLRELTTN